MSGFSRDYLIQQLNWRYSAKRYDVSKKISSEDWHALEEVMRLSASSYGLQPWKFFVVMDPVVREKLKVAAYNQPAVGECSHFVVMATLKKLNETYVDRFLKDMADTRGVEVATLDKFKKNIMDTLVHGPRNSEIHHWSRHQVYIAMGGLLNAAALMKIDVTPMEGLDPKKFDDILNLEQTEYHTVVAMAFGYRAADDRFANVKKVRFQKRDVIETI